MKFFINYDFSTDEPIIILHNNIHSVRLSIAYEVRLTSRGKDKHTHTGIIYSHQVASPTSVHNNNTYNLMMGIIALLFFFLL